MGKDFQTRPDICDYMVSLVPETCIYILEPTPGEGNLVKALETAKKTVITPEGNLWAEIHTYKHFDAVVMNPPFTPMKTGYIILDYCMDLTDSIIALMPWLTIINSTRRTEKIRNYGLKSVTHLPRKAFPGARVQTCILEMQRSWNSTTEFKFF